jgi:hypothetical protein
VVSVGTIIFLSMVLFVFWLSQVGATKVLPSGYWKEA